MSYFLFLFIFLHISFMLAQLNESEISMFWEHKDWLEIKKPPKGPNGGPLIVKMGMYLESLGNFQEAKMSFEVDLYLYMSWRDPALKHNGTEMMMFNDDKIRQRIWLPDLYFTNARYAQFHDVTVPNFNLFIAPDGTVAYSTRVTLNVACNLNLKNYPMDKQSCTIRVTSYAYIASIVNVTWFAKYPLMYNHEIGLPEFTFIKVSAEYCDGTYRYAITENEYKQAEFSCLDGTLYLQRSLGFNMVQSYIPTGLIVIISWVSFWIDRRAVPARVTLSFTTLVSLTTIGNGMRFALPQVSYAKAIDYWFGACMLFLFLSLIEFALVNSYMRKSEKYERLSSKYLVEKGDMLILPSFQRTTNEMMKIRRQSSIATKQKFVNLWKRKVFERMSEESSITSPGISEHCASKVRFACETSEENSPEVETDQSEQDSVYDNLSPTSIDNNNLSNCNIGIDYKTPLKNSKFPKYDDSNRMGKKSQRHNGNINGTSISPNQLLSLQYLEVSQILSNRALQIDKISRYLFPIIFTCFNIIYWIYYLVYQK